jgi:hypothetical protein
MYVTHHMGAQIRLAYADAIRGGVAARCDPAFPVFVRQLSRNRRTRMSGIFISYRRGDGAGYAGRLFDRLTDHFGRDQVFMDVSDIEPGADFVEAIERAVGSCDVLVAVIGNQWLDCTDADGARRLDDPNDFVRLEIGRALTLKLRVIPLLIRGATMPPADDLPPDLSRLSSRQALELSDNRWDYDTGRPGTSRRSATFSQRLASRVPRRPPGEIDRNSPWNFP